MTKVPPYSGFNRKAFTLIELLVVIAIISLLLAVLIPVLKKARYNAKTLICCSNLSSISKAIYAYAADNKDAIPLGPRALPSSGANFYPATGNVTSLLSRLGDGAPVGLGLLLNTYLSSQPKVLFCPGADQPADADKQLALIGKSGDQAQGDYYYRHGSVIAMADSPTLPVYIRLSDLGKNRNRQPITALAIDVQFFAHPSMQAFRVVTRTSHRVKLCNILFADGTVRTYNNTDNRMTIRITASPQESFNKILGVFEFADTVR